MKSLAVSGLALMVSTAAAAQSPSFAAGQPLGVVIDGKRTPISPNVKVHGAIVNAESCSYDAERDLILAVNRGADQSQAPNDGFVSLINHDGTVHTAKWIGATRDGLVLNQPFGSAIHNGKLYVADSDGATADGAPRVSVLRLFDMKSGAPAGEVRVPGSPWFNDIAVATDGTVYATQTGTADGATPMRVWKITRDGKASIFIDGAPLSLPNGIAMDNDGNIVVVNKGDTKVMTFSPTARLLKTEHSAQAGSDGLVIMPDGTKYVGSVEAGGISRIVPGKPAELIATGIPTAASMCFDPTARQLVIPMNANNGLAFVAID
jgi:hypothetical protein